MGNLVTYRYALAIAKLRESDLLTGAINAAKNAPVVPAPVEAERPARLTVDQAISKYLRNVEVKSKRTSKGYGYTLKQFRQAGDKIYLDEVKKQSLIDFVGYLRGEKLSDRTIHNRIGEVITLLRHFGIEDVKLRVKYVEQKVSAYRPDELKALFAAATPDEWLLFQFFLCSGAREQEVMNAEWNDIDFMDGLFTVRAKANWKPKDFEEREVPLPDFLLAALRANQNGHRLLFPNEDGKPNGHMLRILKTLAPRAGLTGKFKLHKFRKSYATLQHRAGVDARTIQKRLGHSDLTTTLAYLEGEEARSERSREQVNGTFAVYSASSAPGLVS